MPEHGDHWKASSAPAPPPHPRLISFSGMPASGHRRVSWQPVPLVHEAWRGGLCLSLSCCQACCCPLPDHKCSCCEGGREGRSPCLRRSRPQSWEGVGGTESPLELAGCDPPPPCSGGSFGRGRPGGLRASPGELCRIPGGEAASLHVAHCSPEQPRRPGACSCVRPPCSPSKIPSAQARMPHSCELPPLGSTPIPASSFFGGGGRGGLKGVESVAFAAFKVFFF